MFQVRLAAKSKMDSNISDLLPVTSQGLAHGDDPLAGRLKFSDQAPVVRPGNGTVTSCHLCLIVTS